MGPSPIDSWWKIITFGLEDIPLNLFLNIFSFVQLFLLMILCWKPLNPHNHPFLAFSGLLVLTSGWQMISSFCWSYSHLCACPGARDMSKNVLMLTFRCACTPGEPRKLFPRGLQHWYHFYIFYHMIPSHHWWHFETAISYGFSRQILNYISSLHLICSKGIIFYDPNLTRGKKFPWWIKVPDLERKQNRHGHV